MNIFYLDRNPVTCAQMHCDKHVVKMIVEYAQLMSTAHRLLDNNELVYKATHPKHPSAIWTRASKLNYEWLLQLWTVLLDEYTHRYGKRHACEKMYTILFNAPVNIGDGPFTQPTPAMPDQYKVVGDSILSYRQYYVGAKKSFLSWKKRQPPDWVLNTTKGADNADIRLP